MGYALDLNRYYTLHFSTTGGSGPLDIAIGRDAGTAWSFHATNDFGFDGTDPSAGSDLFSALGAWLSTYLMAQPTSTLGTVTYLSATGPGPDITI